MILTFVAAIILAKVRHYKVGVLFKTWTFYPFLLAQCIFWFFQFNVFSGNYFFVQYAWLVKVLTIGCFVFPLLVFGLYKPAFVGIGTITLGTLMNKFAMSQNGGKMPVFPTLSYWTGYAKPEAFNLANDIHILGGPDTKWKILTDYIDVGYSILSPGDVLIHFFTFIMLYSMIKALNKGTEVPEGPFEQGCGQ